MTLRSLANIIIAGCASLLILSGVVVFYSFSGIHIENPSLATDYKWESSQLKSTMTEGFSFFCMDEDGFNNVVSYGDDKSVSILLMGSSQMEAVNVGKRDNAGYLLGQLLPDQSVYNIGISGHQLYNCVNNLPSALEYYRPTDYVVIVTDSVDMDTDLMRQVLKGEYPRIPSYDSGVVYYVQKWIPAVKVLYKNISDWKAMDAVISVPEEVAVTRDLDAVSVDQNEEVLDEFMNLIAALARDNHVRPIIVYQSPLSIDGEGKIADEIDQNVERFRISCEKNDIKFIDMTDSFIELYEEEHKMPHGFANTAVGSGHLNKYGHRVIAKEIAKYVSP